MGSYIYTAWENHSGHIPNCRGQKNGTDNFLVVRVDQSFVQLNEVAWNEMKSTLERKGNPFRVELEKVHFIMDGNLGIWPASGKRKG